MGDHRYGVPPSPATTIIVRRQSFLRVPPELLLREHARRFRMSGLTLASLVNAVTPHVYDAVPPFIAQTDINGELNHEFIDILLKEMTKMPTVTREDIKESSVIRKRNFYDGGKLKGPPGMIKTPPSLLNTTAWKKEVVRNDDVPFTFGEAGPSHLTAVGIVRIKSTTVVSSDAGADSKRNPSLSAKVKTAVQDCELEEREVLWGYDTGAVVHVRLRIFALDLQVLRQYETLLPAHRRHSSVRTGGDTVEIGIDDSRSNSSSELPEKDDSFSKSVRDTEEVDDMFDSMKNRAPSGVSLLGYHSIGSVSCLVYDAANDLAISGGADGSLLVWDLHQRYRAAYRERHLNDDELRQMRPTQQFSAYVRTRRLVQRICHAHSGGISTLTTHCELLLSGGVDGAVKVWLMEHSPHHSFSGALPQYIERQVFHCRGWVRHIWCAPERNVQGDDILITSESGDITCLKGFTVSQQPVVKAPRGRHKVLLDALRKSGNTLLTSDVGSKRHPRLAMHPPTLDALVKTKYDDEVTALSDLSPSERKAFKLLNSGVISRALRRTRTLKTISEEGYLASAVGKGPSLREASTNTITRIVPMVELHLFITLGYSSMVRFLDMSGKSVAAVEHPFLTATRERGNRDGGTLNSDNNQSRCMKKEQGGGVENVQFAINKKGTSYGRVYGKSEALRFIDVLYVSSCNYLILLDNRNTVFVWDYTENTMLASWDVPHMSEGKKNAALSLLPCGTRHYEGGSLSDKDRLLRKTLYGPQRPVTGCPQYIGETGEEMIDDNLTGVTKIPFFVVCSRSLELCDIVVDSQARLEFEAHPDTIVGIFIRQDPPAVSSRNENPNKETLLTGVVIENSDPFERNTRVIDNNGMNILPDTITAPFAGNTKEKPNEEICNLVDASETDDNKFDNSDIALRRFYRSLYKTEDSNRLRVLSCSADGTIKFWGNLFEPLRIFNHKTLASKCTRYCTTTTHKPVSSDDTISPFDAPPRIVREKRTGEVIEVENDGCGDTTSFYFSAHWNLAVTGHDDGSVRFWPCNQQLITFAWHKRIHRNAVSGLMEARIGKTEKQRRLRFLQGKSNEVDSKHEATELLATVSYDGYLAVWERPEQANIRLYARTRVGPNELLCVAFEDVNELFVVGDSSGAVSSWSARELEPRCKIPSQPSSPWRPGTASTLTLAPSSVPACNLKSNTSEGYPTKRVGHGEAVTAFLVDKNHVFSGGEDGRVFQWDLNIGILIREYFLLHDTEAIGYHQRRRKIESLPKMYDTTMYTNEGNHCITGTSNCPVEEVPWVPRENVTSLILLKRHRGDFLVATREGWIYHFRQDGSYPHATYEHSTSIRSMCLLRASWEGEEEREARGRDDMTLNSESKGLKVTETFLRNNDLAFEVVLGCEDGNIAVIRETYFTATV